MISLFDDFLQWFVLWNEIVAVTMQAQKEAPPDFQCKDKFLLLSVVAPDGATAKDIGPDMVGPLLLFFFFFLKLNFVLNLSWILMVSEFDCSLLRRTVRLSRSLSCGLFTFLLIPPHLSLKDLKKDLPPGHSHKKMGITIIHHLTM